MDFLEYFLLSWFSDRSLVRRHREAVERLKYLEDKYRDYPAPKAPSIVETQTVRTLNWLFSPAKRRAHRLEMAKLKRQTAELKLKAAELRRQERANTRAEAIHATHQTLRQALTYLLAVFGAIMLLLIVVIALVQPHTK